MQAKKTGKKNMSRFQKELSKSSVAFCFWVKYKALGHLKRIPKEVFKLVSNFTEADNTLIFQQKAATHFETHQRFRKYILTQGVSQVACSGITIILAEEYFLENTRKHKQVQ
jgi:hypothetical protein